MQNYSNFGGLYVRRGTEVEFQKYRCPLNSGWSHRRRQQPRFRFPHRPSTQRMHAQLFLQSAATLASERARNYDYGIQHWTVMLRPLERKTTVTWGKWVEQEEGVGSYCTLKFTVIRKVISYLRRKREQESWIHATSYIQFCTSRYYRTTTHSREEWWMLWKYLSSIIRAQYGGRLKRGLLCSASLCLCHPKLQVEWTPASWQKRAAMDWISSGF